MVPWYWAVRKRHLHMSFYYCLEILIVVGQTDYLWEHQSHYLHMLMISTWHLLCSSSTNHFQYPHKEHPHHLVVVQERILCWFFMNRNRNLNGKMIDWWAWLHPPCQHQNAELYISMQWSYMEIGWWIKFERPGPQLMDLQWKDDIKEES